jgi:hypothetical protein
MRSGSEAGHAEGEYSHGNGYKMDFQKNDGLNGYITGTFTQIENRFDGYPQWKAASGNIYCVSGANTYICTAKIGGLSRANAICCRMRETIGM